MSKLPVEPCGWRLLIKVKEPPAVTKGGIILTDAAKDTARLACMLAEVMALGPDCYKDTERYASPWCAVGDTVLIGKFVGSRFKKVNGDEYRVINEDEILGVVPDPTAITGA